MKHRCHAIGCQTETAPELLMCLKHWKMVPHRIKQKVWSSYRSGQCDDKRPSKDFLESAKAAIQSVKEAESK